MPLETASHIAELEPNNPTFNDPGGRGDDHLRLIKSALKGTFSAFTGQAVTLTEAQLNALPTDITTAITALRDELLPHLVPTGMIALWSGSTASIPSGWQLCDGTNGTEDLRDRFVVGAGGSYGVNAAGGATSKSTNSDGGHNHSGSAGDHALTVNQMPSHDHGGKIKSYVSASGTFQPVSFPAITGSKVHHENSGHTASTDTNFDLSGGAVVPSEGGGQAHSHSIGTDGAHTHTVNVLPPYYAKAYIQKVSTIS